MKVKMVNWIRTSPPWDSFRQVKNGETVIAKPATNLPGTGKYWIYPTSKRAEWYADAHGPYGVLAYSDDFEETTP